MSALTLERARELLCYDPTTGLLTWKVRVGPRALQGGVAGYLDKKGYVYVGLDGKYYFGHRVAWLLHFGRWPAGQVDHWDEVKSNNRISNLREVTSVENMHNQRQARKHNRLGLRGVSKNHTKFQAEILADGKRIYLGVFDTPLEAHAAYLAAKKQYHPTSAR